MAGGGKRLVEQVALGVVQYRGRFDQGQQRHFQRLGHRAQGLEADRGGGAGQGVGRFQSRRGHRAQRFMPPLAEVLGQHPHQFVGFGQVDVIQRQRDFQVAETADIVRRRHLRHHRRKIDDLGAERRFRLGRRRLDRRLCGLVERLTVQHTFGLSKFEFEVAIVHRQRFDRVVGAVVFARGGEVGVRRGQRMRLVVHFADGVHCAVPE